MSDVDSAANNAKAEALVLSVLADPVLTNFEFTLGKWKIEKGFYGKIADAIRQKKITVVFDQSTPFDAVYAGEKKIGNATAYDVIFLKTTEITGSISHVMNLTGLIIHECTHAGLDMLKLQKMTHLEQEAIAYTAGAYAIWLKALSRGGRPSTIQYRSKIHAAAWEVASELASSGKISIFSTVALTTAIYLHPMYNKTALKWSNNDGVGAEWQL